MSSTKKVLGVLVTLGVFAALLSFVTVQDLGFVWILMGVLAFIFSALLVFLIIALIVSWKRKSGVSVSGTPKHGRPLNWKYLGYGALALLGVPLLLYVLFWIPWNLGDFFAGFSIESLSVPVLLAILGIAIVVALFWKKRVLTALFFALAVLLVFTFRTHIDDTLGTNTFAHDWDIDEACTPDSRRCILRTTNPERTIVVRSRGFGEYFCYAFMPTHEVHVRQWDANKKTWAEWTIYHRGRDLNGNPVMTRGVDSAGNPIRVYGLPLRETLEHEFMSPDATAESPLELRIQHFRSKSTDTEYMSACRAKKERWWMQ